MTLQASRCDDRPLHLLLATSEPADPALVRELTAHLEHCAACQSRLESLAGDETFWTEARVSLSTSDEFAWRPDASWVALAPFDRNPEPRNDASLRQVLESPRHPELLGRLGRYDIERVIGAGGMGIVLKAHDSELNRPVAVKILASHLAHVGAARERFAREGRAAAAVVHEHVVAIYNVESSGAVPFLVMQYVPGRSLQARVDVEGPLAVEEILRIGMQAAAGLAAAHAQGLVHRDVKPANILLEDSVERAVLTDFGLARAIDDASLTHTGILAGTPHYMSPEQATGEAIDHRSDLFSLGAVLYFMATGHPPFRADGALAVLHRLCHDQQRPAWQTNHEVPDELSELIDQLLEKKPSRRPATAADVSQRLAKQLSRFQQFGPTRRRWSVWRDRRSRRRLVGSLAAVLAAAAAIGYFTPTRGGNTGAPTAATGWTESRPATQENSDLQRSFEQSLAREHEMAAEFQAVQQAVGVSERQPIFSTSADDAWRRELQAIDRELRGMEAQQGSDQ